MPTAPNIIAGVANRADIGRLNTSGYRARKPSEFGAGN
jgi:hypothetical protein